MNIRIGIVEDQIKIMDRLKARLSFYDDFIIIMEAQSCKECLKKLNDLPSQSLPQVILMDIELPGKSGIEATQAIKATYPDIEILIQTVFENEEKIFQSIHAGASGYLLKDDPIQKYVDSIYELINGGAALSPSIATKVITFIKNENESKEEKVRESAKDFSLTERELEILHGIIDDLTIEHIGEKYFISPHTVRVHIKNIYKKLHVHSRAAAVRFAITNGLYS
ncbi:MAG: response regulator transcription factor [Gracilimonas sp.]